MLSPLRYVGISRNAFEGYYLQTLFNGLPPTLRCDVHYFVGRPFFDSLRCLDTLPLWFKRYLSLQLKEEMYLQGDRLIKVGDVVTRCYYLTEGGEGVAWEEGGREIKVSDCQVLSAM